MESGIEELLMVVIKVFQNNKLLKLGNSLVVGIMSSPYYMIPKNRHHHFINEHLLYFIFSSLIIKPYDGVYAEQSLIPTDIVKLLSF